MKIFLKKAKAKNRCLACFLFLFFGFFGVSQSRILGLQGRPGYVSGEILVKFKEGVSSADVTRSLAVVGAAAQDLKFPFKKIKLKGGMTVLQAVEQMKKDPLIVHAQPNYIYYASSCGPPTDTYYTTSTYNWPFLKVHAPEAWNLFSCSPSGPGSSSVTVAVLDTGISKNHPDLAGVSYATGFNTFDSSSNTDDDYGHGTFVSGIIAAQWNSSPVAETCGALSTTGMAGMAPGITLMPVKVLKGVYDPSLGVTVATGETSNIVAGLQYAADSGARVLNLSLGSSASDGFEDIEKDALDHALASGCVIVASAGNDIGGPINFPAAYPPVVAVGATDNNDQVACYSNVGPQLDLVAPGGQADTSDGCFGNSVFSPTTDIFSAMLKCPISADPEFPLDPADSNFGSAAGTSASAPFVSGTAALILSMYPSLTNAQVVARILNNTDSLNGNKGWDERTGYGRLNVYRALYSAGALTPTPSPEITGYMTTFNSPNPYYPDSDGLTNITLAIDQAEAVELWIYDTSGEIVLHKNFSASELNSNPSNPQFKSFYVTWDGKNGGGQRAKNGIYFYTVKAGGKTARNKIALIQGTR